MNLKPQSFFLRFKKDDEGVFRKFNTGKNKSKLQKGGMIMKLKKRRKYYNDGEYLDEVKFEVMKSISETSGFVNRPF